MARWILLTAVVMGTLALLAMTAATFVWMTVPVWIVYRESSPVRTETHSVEVMQHGQSCFLTPRQKGVLDSVHKGTPLVWFGSLGIGVAATLVGAAARLRL